MIIRDETPSDATEFSTLRLAVSAGLRRVRADDLCIDAP